MKEPALYENYHRGRFGGKTIRQIQRFLSRADRLHACLYKASGMLVYHDRNYGWEVAFAPYTQTMPVNYCPGCGIALRRVTRSATGYTAARLRDLYKHARAAKVPRRVTGARRLSTRRTNKGDAPCMIP